MKEYKIGIATYYSKSYINGMRLLLNKLKGVEVVREELTVSCVDNVEEVAIYVKLIDEDALQCLQLAADFDAFTLCPITTEQANLSE